MHHGFTIGDSEYGIELSRGPSGYRLHLGDTVLDIRVTAAGEGRHVLEVGADRFDVVIGTRGDDVFVHLDGETHQLRYRHPLERLAAQRQGATQDAIRAAMPGTLVTVRVSPGDAVVRGQELLVMESMKMETSLVAPRDGVVATLEVEKGAAFDRGTLLLTLKADERPG
jgi:acetyl/propionyl-CoA carboxylase alpha subunit